MRIRIVFPGCLVVLLLWGVGEWSATRTHAATLLVTNTNDGGADSLRSALLEAVAGDTILFAPSVRGTITLTSGLLPVVRNVTTTGPGASELAISGNNSGSVLNVTGATASISGVTIRDGKSSGSGGAIFNAGTLTLQDVLVSSSSANNDGGGILNTGTMTLSRTWLQATRQPGRAAAS